MRDVRIAHRPFSSTEEFDRFHRMCGDAGGVVSFLGQVRREDGRETVHALELRHFEPLTLPGMVQLAQQAIDLWSLTGISIVHRVGIMEPGDPIVCVSTAARHRRDAFAAAEFVMDHLKSRAWFWKRERTAAGWRWVEPRDQDAVDLARWSDIIG